MPAGLAWVGRSLTPARAAGASKSAGRIPGGASEHSRGVWRRSAQVDTATLALHAGDNVTSTSGVRARRSSVPSAGSDLGDAGRPRRSPDDRCRGRAGGGPGRRRRPPPTSSSTASLTVRFVDGQTALPVDGAAVEVVARQADGDPRDVHRHDRREWHRGALRRSLARSASATVVLLDVSAEQTVTSMDADGCQTTTVLSAQRLGVPIDAVQLEVDFSPTEQTGTSSITCPSPQPSPTIVVDESNVVFDGGPDGPLRSTPSPCSRSTVAKVHVGRPQSDRVPRRLRSHDRCRRRAVLEGLPIERGFGADDPSSTISPARGVRSSNPDTGLHGRRVAGRRRRNDVLVDADAIEVAFGEPTSSRRRARSSAPSPPVRCGRRRCRNAESTPPPTVPGRPVAGRVARRAACRRARPRRVGVLLLAIRPRLGRR